MLSIATNFSRESGTKFVLIKIGSLILFVAKSLKNCLFDSFSKFTTVRKKLELIVRDGSIGFFIFVREGDSEEFQFFSEATLVFNTQILIHFSQCFGVCEHGGSNSLQSSLKLFIIHLFIVM
jgi:hypothetical protein